MFEVPPIRIAAWQPPKPPPGQTGSQLPRQICGARRLGAEVMFPIFMEWTAICAMNC